MSCHVTGGGDFAGGIFRCGKFRISDVCEISRSIVTPLCEINPVRNLATGAKFSHWGFAGFAGGMLLPPPPFRGLPGFTHCSPPLFPVSCPILHLALLSENERWTVVVTVAVILAVMVSLVSLLQKRPNNSVSQVQVQVLWPFWAPLDTNTMPPLSLGQGLLAWLSWP